MGALSTHSKFYYGWQVTNLNKYLDFYDGVDQRSAVLSLGYYTPGDLATEIAKQMNSASELSFTVLFNRQTRKFTIASTEVFTLRFGTGASAGHSVASVIGFNPTDKTLAQTYESDSASGYEYATQFYIQSYKPTSINRKAIDGIVNKSASGVIEVVKYGNERFMEGEFLYITNITQRSNSIVRSNETGLDSFIQFLEWCTEKAPIDFMVDENNVNNFQELMLESTEADTKGLDYDLTEMYDKGFPYYYRSGKLKFRLME